MGDGESAPDPASQFAGGAEERRTFLSTATSLAMAGGLAASYGTFGVMAGRFLYPAHSALRGWMFVTQAKSIVAGNSFTFKLPSGKPVVITRKGETDETASFLALSSTCPHLGCQVFWEPQNRRFFCPCHNGVFNTEGKATEGPPAKAGQSLNAYPLKVESGNLFIEVPLEGLASSLRRAPAEGVA